MSLQRTNSLSTMSTTTTGSTMFTDARSEFTDAISHTNSINNNVTEEGENFRNPNNNLDESDNKELNLSEDSKVKSDYVKIDDDKKEQAINLQSKEDHAVKTEQPKAINEPSFMTREEKIKQIKEQRQTNSTSTSNEAESDCHAYLFSNNLIDILDLPGWRFWVCGLCTVCCNSLESSGRNTAVKSAQ